MVKSKTKVDILAIGVHPDDVELSCSGTLLRHIDLGHKVAILDLTEGELGTRGNATLRKKEARKAAEILGVDDLEILKIPDGFFEPTPEYKLQIAAAVRRYQPEIVLANAIDDRHPDHGRAARLIYDACFLAGLNKVETHDRDGHRQERWRPKAIYNYVQDKMLLADVIVDITPYMDKKMESILAYSSQFYDPESMEADSPISGADFLEYIKARARGYGRQIGVEYGEGFTVSRPIGSSNLLELI
ncbi:MAG: bacillithiol biosynthesis deacetylase BshB1 [Saprospiraceae bacterium]|nr:bacillithiol biosynthesis deacetylase BshB1 [Saprospiraceae bacterium]